MNKEHNIFEKIGNFVAGKGFYLVVLICVAAIALSGFYLFRSVGRAMDDQEDQPAGATASITDLRPSPSPSPSADTAAAPSPSPITPEPDPEPDTDPEPSVAPTPSATPAPSASPKPAESPAPLVFTWPVNGTVISGYAVDVLAYDVTMEDWRTHSGIDIAASVGTQVMAAASGTVSAVYEDDLMGTTVVIDHGNGLISVYSNLTPVPTVKAGADVSTGTIIGAVGRTAAAESRLDPHLHFSILKNEVAVDPTEYLPKR